MAYLDYDSYVEKIRKYVRIKWKTRELLSILEQFEDELEKAACKTISTEKYKMIVLHLIGKSLITTREIIVLCEAGYSDGAFSLSRSLYEQFIHLCFFMAHEKDSEFDALVNDYNQNGRYQIYKYNLKCSKIYPIDSDELRKELEDIKKNSVHALPQRKPNDYWWAGKKSFSQLEKDAKEFFQQNDDKIFLDKLNLLYTASNRFIHANAAGNQQRLGRAVESSVIDTAPDYLGQGTPLHFVTICMTFIMLRICQLFSMDFDYFKKAMNEMDIFYTNNAAKNMNR